MPKINSNYAFGTLMLKCYPNPKNSNEVCLHVYGKNYWTRSQSGWLPYRQFFANKSTLSSSLNELNKLWFKEYAKNPYPISRKAKLKSIIKTL